jgi:hypothetical protein
MAIYFSEGLPLHLAWREQPGSDEVARTFRDGVARDYEMTSPGFAA